MIFGIANFPKCSLSFLFIYWTIVHEIEKKKKSMKRIWFVLEKFPIDKRFEMIYFRMDESPIFRVKRVTITLYIISIVTRKCDGRQTFSIYIYCVTLFNSSQNQFDSWFLDFGIELKCLNNINPNDIGP